MTEAELRKVILFNMMSVDGYFEGPNGELDWHNVDEEFNRFAVEQLDSAGMLLFGRRTYEMMASYWPGPSGLEDDPETAQRMNSIEKLVFSSTLKDASWSNTRLVREDVAGEVLRLKQQPGKDIFVFGSADLASTMIRLELIDEFRLLVNPILLGRGNPLFKGIDTPRTMDFIDARSFKNGNVLLRYSR
jgi:dihydrofolate reductase